MTQPKKPRPRQQPDSKTSVPDPKASGLIAIMTSELGQIERMADEFVRTTADFGWEGGPLGRASAIGQVISSVLRADPKIPVGIAELLASCALKIHSAPQSAKPEPEAVADLDWTPRFGASEEVVQKAKEALEDWRKEARESSELFRKTLHGEGVLSAIGKAYHWATMAVPQSQVACEFVALLFELHDAHAENARLREQVEQLVASAAEGMDDSLSKLLGEQDGPAAPTE